MGITSRHRAGCVTGHRAGRKSRHGLGYQSTQPPLRAIPLGSALRYGCILALMLIFMCGCGGQSSVQDSLQSAISTYNDSHPHDLAATGSACAQAENDLRNAQDALKQQPSDVRQVPADNALKRAYRLSEAGFASCHTAARTLNYPLMAAAVRQLEDANLWIDRARQLAR